MRHVKAVYSYIPTVLWEYPRKVSSDLGLVSDFYQELQICKHSSSHDLTENDRKREEIQKCKFCSVLDFRDLWLVSGFPQELQICKH